MADLEFPTFVDVDGTLTLDPHDPWGRPHLERIAILKENIKEGETVVLWSARGGTYAQAFADKYEIDAALCISKPECCVDDNVHIRKREVMPILKPNEYFGI